MHELISSYWLIFSFSFVTALTGAMAPGPLLTYTIIKTAKTNNKGYLTGIRVILGHAILEILVIALLIFGFSHFLKNEIVVKIIGVIGGIMLIFFGLVTIKDNLDPKNDIRVQSDDETGDQSSNNKGTIDNPIMGGFLISMANPYWWIWWATIGFAFMAQFNITISKIPRLTAFFIGHELGDLLWYTLVSIFAYFGLKKLNTKIYSVILIVLSSFMILFGFYLGISPFFK